MSSPKRDDPTLSLASGSAHAHLFGQACAVEQQAAHAASWILACFDAYYRESRGIPALAKRAFEQRDPGTSLVLSKRRLSLYSESIDVLGARMRELAPGIAGDPHAWREVESRYWALIRDRYEADLAYAFVNSVRRRIFQGEWVPVDYSFREPSQLPADLSGEVYRAFDGEPCLSPGTVTSILATAGFQAPFNDLDGDARLVCERVNGVLGLDGSRRDVIECIEMINAGFFRNRGAYLVGRILRRHGKPVPLILALLNGEQGIYVHAVLLSEAQAHNIFSSTLANFHVTNTRYHELAAFLHTVMPNRPLGLHYSTIGFNHVGKVAVMNELKHELASPAQRLATAVGFRGTVAIGFSSPSSAYNLKVIRDRPTSGYKWGHFEGVESVLEKYKRVHEINRTGSMLDNIIYYNLKLERSWFEPELLEELLRYAGKCVSLHDGAVVFKYLIVQRRMIPLPVFLEEACQDRAEEAIANLGHCIKNNAAANIYNKDLDARNYGVGGFGKVYLYDYDALEPFTEVKIRTNAERVDGEEDVPDWYFEDGIVFLPEEMEVGLRIANRQHRHMFRTLHGDLLCVDYWQGVQDALRAGKVPSIRNYPQDCDLRADPVEHDA